MADVRSMLRSELASRKAATETAASKKRKATTHDRVQEPKKARANDIADGQIQETQDSLDVQDEALPSPEQASSAQEPTSASDIVDPERETEAPPAVDDVDEDEWAAFERDVATPPPEQRQGISALNAPATIEAQPLGAAELAAQAREAESSQRGQREAEIDDEREEAEARLLDQFDEMDALEERVRKLREKREAIRRGSQAQADGDARPAPETLAEDKDAASEEKDSEGEDEDDDDESDGEWDVWGV